MGKHGKGAPKTEPKKSARGPGRPKRRGPAEVVEAYQREMLPTLEFLVGVRDNEDEQTRERLRAADAIIRIGILDVAEEADPDAKPEPLTVTLVPEWRAPGK